MKRAFCLFFGIGGVLLPFSCNNPKQDIPKKNEKILNYDTISLDSQLRYWTEHLGK